MRLPRFTRPMPAGGDLQPSTCHPAFNTHMAILCCTYDLVCCCVYRGLEIIATTAVMHVIQCCLAAFPEVVVCGSTHHACIAADRQQPRKLPTTQLPSSAGNCIRMLSLIDSPLLSVQIQVVLYVWLSPSACEHVTVHSGHWTKSTEVELPQVVVCKSMYPVGPPPTHPLLFCLLSSVLFCMHCWPFAQTLKHMKKLEHLQLAHICMHLFILYDAMTANIGAQCVRACDSAWQPLDGTDRCGALCGVNGPTPSASPLSFLSTSLCTDERMQCCRLFWQKRGRCRCW
jgi:hypothetical protein